MRPITFSTQLSAPTASDSRAIDIVIPFSSGPLADAALAAARRLTADLTPSLRLVQVLLVPYPLALHEGPVSAATRTRQLMPLAKQFGAHVQLCYSRDLREGLLHLLKRDSVVLIAAPRHWWNVFWPSPEQRLSTWLNRLGFLVLVDFVEANRA